MKKFNLSYKTHLFRILAILCLLSSYLWIAPGQVHASSADLREHDVLGNGEQTYVTGEATADNQAKYLWPTGPLQTDGLSLSISKGGVPQAPGDSNPSTPLQQGPTLAVDIISSPWATVDSNGVPGNPPGDGELPEVFVVEAVISNTGAIADVVVHLDFNPGNGWTLLPGEDPDRIVEDLAPGTPYYAYWFARYPQFLSGVGATHQYTVTVAPVDNPAGSVAASATVQTRETESTANQSMTYASAEVVVGVAFTVTVGFDLGTHPEDAIFSPVGNSDFDPSNYRLIASEVRFYNDSGTWQEIVPDRLYFPTLHSSAQNAEVTYTFLALAPENSRLCPYAGINFGPNSKYDQYYCSESTGTTISIEGTVSLSLTKQASSSTQQGQLLTYTIYYTNDGDMPLSYGWVWDDVDTSMGSIVTTSVNPASDPDETTDSRVAWYLGDIGSSGQVNSTGTLTFAVLVDGDGQDLEDGELLVNHAFFGVSPGVLPPRAVLTSTVTTTVRAPTIAVSKTDGQDLAEPGDALVYTLHIANSGSIATSGLVITDVLPAGVTYTSGATPPQTSRTGQTLVWNNQNVPAGGTLVVTIPVTVNSDVPDETTLINTATVTYRNASGQHTFAAKTATDTTVIHSPVLSITKTAEDVDGGDLVVGDEILYTLQVTNTGTYTAYNVTVTDDLPDQVTCQAVSGDSAPAGCADPLVWTIPSLAPDTTASLYITVTINPGSEWQTITNTASVIGENVPDPPDDPTPVCPDGSTPVDGVCLATPEPPDTSLAIDKTAEDVNGPPLAVSDTIRYTLQVTNTGTYTAYNVTVTDDLPGQVTCQAVSGDSAPAGCADPLVWTIPSLAPDDTASLYVDVTVDPGSEGQTITNTASVTGTNVPTPPVDPPPVCPDGSQPNGEGECEITPVPSTTLDFTKTAEDVNGPPLVVGDEILYTLQVTNTGAYTAYNVTVTDDLPVQVTCQAVSGDSAPAGCADPLVWTISELPAGSDNVATLLITVTIRTNAAGQSIINTGVITGSNVPDPPPNPRVCPDGSPPVGDVCETTPEPASGGGIFLPIIRKNYRTP